MRLNNYGLLLGSVLTLGIIGCSSSSPSEPLTGGNGGPSGNGGSSATGENPGVVRMPILGELTSISLSNLGGHVVYAGPTEVFFEGYSFANIDFGCNGTGNFELFPAAEVASFLPVVKGTTAWRLSNDGEDVNVDITAVTEGGGGVSDFDADSISVNPVSAGTLIAGESTIQSKIVASILQYEECG